MAESGYEHPHGHILLETPGKTWRVVLAPPSRMQARGLPPEAINEMAEYLGMPPIAVFEVASFYNMYNLQPPGRCKLTICTNLPCALSGANQAAEHLKHRLGIGFGETTADGEFTLREGECLGACGDAPVLLVNNKRMESFMSNERLDALLDEMKQVK